MNTAFIGRLLGTASKKEKDIEMPFKRTNSTTTTKHSAPTYSPDDDIATVNELVPTKPGKPHGEYTEAKERLIKNLGEEQWSEIYATAKASKAPAVEVKRSKPKPSNSSPRFEINGVTYTLNAAGNAVPVEEEDEDEEEEVRYWYAVPANGYPTKIADFKLRVLTFFEGLNAEEDTDDALIQMANSLESELQARLGGSIAHIRPIVWVVSALLKESNPEISEELLATEKSELARRKTNHE